MTAEHEDQSGVFVPFWMLREAPSPAAAVALAQITWWFQPSLRGQDRERFIERKGERWLAMTDQRLGDALGLSEDAAHRIKRVLKREGYIMTAVAKVDGVRCSLIRPVLEVLQRRAEPADMRDSRPAESRDSSSRDIAAPIPLIETGIEKKETTSNDAVRRTADRIVIEWWEARKAQGEAPVQPYIAVVKIVDRALRNGVTVNDLRRALAACATVTAASLEFTLSKQRGKVGRQPPNVSSAAAQQIVSDYEQANGPGPRNGAGSALPLRP